QQRDLGTLLDDGGGSKLSLIANHLRVQLFELHPIAIERVYSLREKRALVNPLAEFGTEHENCRSLAVGDQPHGFFTRGYYLDSDSRSLSQVSLDDTSPGLFGKLLLRGGIIIALVQVNH